MSRKAAVTNEFNNFAPVTFGYFVKIETVWFGPWNVPRKCALLNILST